MDKSFFLLIFRSQGMFAKVPWNGLAHLVTFAAYIATRVTCDKVVSICNMLYHCTCTCLILPLRNSWLGLHTLSPLLLNNKSHMYYAIFCNAYLIMHIVHPFPEKLLIGLPHVLKTDRKWIGQCSLVCTSVHCPIHFRSVFKY